MRPKTFSETLKAMFNVFKQNVALRKWSDKCFNANEWSGGTYVAQTLSSVLQTDGEEVSD
jgi:hypothetical protein